MSARRGFALIDVLVGAGLLGFGVIVTLTLLSQSRTRTRHALEDFWARRITLSDVSRHALLGFGALQARLSDPQESRTWLARTDPRAERSGIPASLYDSMKIERTLTFSQPSSMPEVGFLESRVAWTGSDGTPQEVRLARLLISPKTYATSPLSAPASSRTTAAPASRVTSPGEPAEALEPEVDEQPPRFVDAITEMIHDANHRGQLAADVFKLARGLASTRAGQDARYRWERIGGVDFDPAYRLKLIDQVVAGVPIPDGVYSYRFREESYQIEHQPYAYFVYDLVGANGVPYVLARHAPKDSDGWQLEGVSAFELGYHRAIAKPGTPARWSRVWATRRRLYAFAPVQDRDGRLVPGELELTIRTLPEPIPETEAPQDDDPRVPGWVGGALRALPVEPSATAQPGLAVDLRRLLGA